MLINLGICSGDIIYFGNPPENYLVTLGALPTDITMQRALRQPVDFIHCFAKEKAHLEAVFPQLKNSLATDGILWISWPKGIDYFL